MAAALVRLTGIDGAPFKLDEADALARARALVDQGVMPVDGGRMSWGLPDPTLVIYLLALPALVARDPAVALVFLALLHAATVTLAAFIGRRYFGRWAGVTAGLLYAFGPWATYFGQHLWVHLIPLLTALALLATLEVIVKRRPAWAVVALAALGLQGQTHLLAVLYLPPAVATGLVFRHRWWSRATLLGLLLAGAVSLPYLGHLWSLRDEVSAAVSTRAAPAMPSLTVVGQLLWGASGAHLQDLLGEAPPTSFAPYSSLLTLAHFVIAGLVALGSVEAVLATARRMPGWEGRLVLVLWTWLPVALLAAASAPVPLHYATTLYPSVFLLAGTGAQRAAHLLVATWPRSPRRLHGAVAALLAAVCGIQLAASVALGSAARDAELGGAIGVPLGTWRTIATRARALAAEQGTNEIAVLTRGSEPAHADWPAALAYLLGPDVRVQFFDGVALTLAPDRPTIYLHVLGHPDATGLLDLLGQPKDLLPLPGSRASARIYVVPALSAENLARLPAAGKRKRLSAGVRFLGYQRPSAVRRGSHVDVTTYWLIASDGTPARGDDLAFFHHLIDERGQAVAQQDGRGLPSVRWQDGRLLVERHLLRVAADAPVGTYRLLGGLYARRDGRRALVRDEDVPDERESADQDTLDLGSISIQP